MTTPVSVSLPGISPVVRDTSHTPSSSTNTEQFEVCRYWLKNPSNCRAGEECKFQHVQQDTNASKARMHQQNGMGNARGGNNASAATSQAGVNSSSTSSNTSSPTIGPTSAWAAKREYGWTKPGAPGPNVTTTAGRGAVKNIVPPTAQPLPRVVSDQGATKINLLPKARTPGALLPQSGPGTGLLAYPSALKPSPQSISAPPPSIQSNSAVEDLSNKICALSHTTNTTSASTSTSSSPGTSTTNSANSSRTSSLSLSMNTSPSPPIQGQAGYQQIRSSQNSSPHQIRTIGAARPLNSSDSTNGKSTPPRNLGGSGQFQGSHGQVNGNGNALLPHPPSSTNVSHSAPTSVPSTTNSSVISSANASRTSTPLSVPSVGQGHHGGNGGGGAPLLTQTPPHTVAQVRPVQMGMQMQGQAQNAQGGVNQNVPASSGGLAPLMLSPTIATALPPGPVQAQMSPQQQQAQFNQAVAFNQAQQLQWQAQKQQQMQQQHMQQMNSGGRQGQGTGPRQQPQFFPMQPQQQHQQQMIPGGPNGVVGGAPGMPFLSPSQQQQFMLLQQQAQNVQAAQNAQNAQNQASAQGGQPQGQQGLQRQQSGQTQQQQQQIPPQAQQQQPQQPIMLTPQQQAQMQAVAAQAQAMQAQAAAAAAGMNMQMHMPGMNGPVPMGVPGGFFPPGLTGPHPHQGMPMAMQGGGPPGMHRGMHMPGEMHHHPSQQQHHPHQPPAQPRDRRLEVCRFWMSGNCRFMDSPDHCAYAHPQSNQGPLQKGNIHQPTIQAQQQQQYLQQFQQQQQQQQLQTVQSPSNANANASPEGAMPGAEGTPSSSSSGVEGASSSTPGSSASATASAPETPQSSSEPATMMAPTPLAPPMQPAPIPTAPFGGWLLHDRVHTWKSLVILEKSNATEKEKDLAKKAASAGKGGKDGGKRNVNASSSPAQSPSAEPILPSNLQPAHLYPTHLHIYSSLGVTKGKSFQSLFQTLPSGAATKNGGSVDTAQQNPIKFLREIVQFMEHEHGIFDYHVCIVESKRALAGLPPKEPEAGSNADSLDVASVKSVIHDSSNWHVKVIFGGHLFPLEPREKCMGCEDKENSALIEQFMYNNVWLDAQGRSMIIVTPHSHHERISALTDQQFHALYFDAFTFCKEAKKHVQDALKSVSTAAAAVVAAAATVAGDASSATAIATAKDIPATAPTAAVPTPPFIYETLILNQGLYRNFAHLHLKARLPQAAWNLLTLTNPAATKEDPAPFLHHRYAQQMKQVQRLKQDPKLKKNNYQLPSGKIIGTLPPGGPVTSPPLPSSTLSVSTTGSVIHHPHVPQENPQDSPPLVSAVPQPREQPQSQQQQPQAQNFPPQAQQQTGLPQQQGQAPPGVQQQFSQPQQPQQQWFSPPSGPGMTPPGMAPLEQQQPGVMPSQQQFYPAAPPMSQQQPQQMLPGPHHQQPQPGLQQQYHPQAMQDAYMHMVQSGFLQQLQAMQYHQQLQAFMQAQAAQQQQQQQVQQQQVQPHQPIDPSTTAPAASGPIVTSSPASTAASSPLLSLPVPVDPSSSTVAAGAAVSGSVMLPPPAMMPVPAVVPVVPPPAVLPAPGLPAPVLPVPLPAVASPSTPAVVFPPALVPGGVAPQQPLLNLINPALLQQMVQAQSQEQHLAPTYAPPGMPYPMPPYPMQFPNSQPGMFFPQFQPPFYPVVGGVGVGGPSHRKKKNPRGGGGGGGHRSMMNQNQFATNHQNHYAAQMQQQHQQQQLHQQPPPQP